MSNRAGATRLIHTVAVARRPLRLFRSLAGYQRVWAPRDVVAGLVLAHDTGQVRDLCRAAEAEDLLADVYPSVQAAIDAVS
jgi:hypothetical protein